MFWLNYLKININIFSYISNINFIFTISFIIFIYFITFIVIITMRMMIQFCDLGNLFACGLIAVASRPAGAVY